MDFDKYFNKLLKLKEYSVLQQITEKFDQYNYLGNFNEEIDIEFSDEEISTFGDVELLYRYLFVWKKIAQTSLNNYKNRIYIDECTINDRPLGQAPVENKGCPLYNQYMLESKFNDKKTIANFIFKYLFILSLISNKEWKEQCVYCDSFLPRNGNKCLDCSSHFDSKRKIKVINKVVKNKKEKIDRTNSSLCLYCDNELINGSCSICGSDFSNILNDNVDNQTLITNENYAANDETLEISVNVCNVSDTSNSPMTKDTSPYWICIMCTFKNDGDNENCFTCMYEKSEDTKVINSTDTDKSDDKYFSSNSHQNKSSIDYLQFWECKHCTFKNKISDYQCEVCNTAKDFETDINFSLPEEKWLCKRCNNNNTFDHYKCNRCNELADFVNKWRCEKCSYVNEKLEFTCGACEIKNPNLIKCPKCNKKDINQNYDKMCSSCILKIEITPKNEGKKEIVRKQDDEEQIKTDKNKNKIINKNEKKLGSSSVFYSSDSDKAIAITDSQSKLLYDTNTKTLCRKCKNSLESSGNIWCQKCELNRWYCHNTKCATINFKNKSKDKQFCSKCKVEMNADLSNCKNVWVLNNHTKTLMWQCEFCKIFNRHKSKCHCGYLRPGGDYKKCHCKWNNLKFLTSCQNCGSEL